MARKRNYKAEYQRRQTLAKARGFKGYAAQRRAIETGKAAPIQASRVRSRRTLDAQFKAGRGIFSLNMTQAQQDQLALKTRMDMAQGWSNTRSHSPGTKFDRARAERDPGYLDAYTQSVVFDSFSDPTQHRFSRSEAMRHYLVDVAKIMTQEEYDDAYPDK